MATIYLTLNIFLLAITIAGMESIIYHFQIYGIQVKHIILALIFFPAGLAWCAIWGLSWGLTFLIQCRLFNKVVWKLPRPKQK